MKIVSNRHLTHQNIGINKNRTKIIPSMGKFVGPDGLEPPTPPTASECSNQGFLTYQDILELFPNFSKISNTFRALMLQTYLKV